MKKINITNRLKEQLQEKGKKEEIVTIEKSITEDELKEILDLKAINSISEDKELVDFLKENTIKLFNIQAKSIVLIGEVLTNVFERLSKQGSSDGVYEKWLKLNNFNKQTALRYRKRYELYNSVTLDKKNIILLLPQKYIDLIYSEENKKKYIELINKGTNKKEIMELIDNQEIIIPVSENTWEVIPEFNYVQKFIKLSDEIDNKIKELDEKKKRDLQKYLKKIEELLK